MQELIRRRRRFFGRLDELAAFRANLAVAPADDRAAHDGAAATDRAAWLDCEAAVTARLRTGGGPPVPGAVDAVHVLVACAPGDRPRADADLDALPAAGPSRIALAPVEHDLGYLADRPGTDAARLTATATRIRAARLVMERAAADADGAAPARRIPRGDTGSFRAFFRPSPPG